MGKTYRRILSVLTLSALLLSGCAGKPAPVDDGAAAINPAPSAEGTAAVDPAPSAAGSETIKATPSAAGAETPATASVPPTPGADPTPAPAGTEAPEATPAETEPSAEPAQDESAESGVTFEGTDIKGNTVTGDVFSQSKLTMVNVWATYCGPCLSEMPSLGELAGEYAAEDFQIIGIVSDVLAGSDQSYAESLIEETGANYTHLLLNESVYYALLTDVAVVPTTFFVDGEGTVLDTVLGAREKTEWEDLINGLLEKQ